MTLAERFLVASPRITAGHVADMVREICDEKRIEPGLIEVESNPRLGELIVRLSAATHIDQQVVEEHLSRLIPVPMSLRVTDWPSGVHHWSGDRCTECGIEWRYGEPAPPVECRIIDPSQEVERLGSALQEIIGEA